MTDAITKAECAYEASRATRPTFAGYRLPPWGQLDAEIRAVWVAKVADVEADPKRWIDSDDPSCVAVALAVIGPLSGGGSG